MYESPSANLPRICGTLLLGALVAVLVGIPNASPAQTRVSVGARAGLNWSKLIQPVDPKDSITLMHGTAFDGVGYTVGGSGTLHFADLGGPRLGVELDALYSRHRATGFERNPSTGAKRTAVLTADVLRVPALLLLQFGESGPSSGLFVGIGPELWAGLRSGASVTLEHTSAQASALSTTPVTHLTFDATVGFDLPATRRLSIPIELRGTWDPFVGRSTVDRFQGYTHPATPGSYEVAFNWQLTLLTGFSWGLLL